MPSFRILALLLLTVASLSADVVVYQGSISLDGKPYTGAARFRFEIHSADGTPPWSSGEMDLLVRNGLYSVRLGDPEKGPALPPEKTHPSAKLRIFFQHATRGWQPAGADVPLHDASFAGAPPATSDSPQNEALLAEIRELRQLLQAKGGEDSDHVRPAVQRTVSLPLRDGPFIGQEDAPLVLIEYTDFQDPASQVHYTDAFPGMLEGYVKTGKVRIYPRQLPKHAHSEPAARAVLCAGQQGKYWELREKLALLGNNLSPETIAAAVSQTGLDAEALAECQSARSTVEAVLADVRDAEAVGILQPPAFILGRKSGDMVHGILLTGFITIPTWETEIYRMLTTPANLPAPP